MCSHWERSPLSALSSTAWVSTCHLHHLMLPNWNFLWQGSIWWTTWSSHWRCSLFQHVQVLSFFLVLINYLFGQAFPRCSEEGLEWGNSQCQSAWQSSFQCLNTTHCQVPILIPIDLEYEAPRWLADMSTRGNIFSYGRVPLTLTFQVLNQHLTFALYSNLSNSRRRLWTAWWHPLGLPVDPGSVSCVKTGLMFSIGATLPKLNGHSVNICHKVHNTGPSICA